MSKARPFFRVDNYQELGKLLTTWVTNPQNEPQNFNDLLTQFATAGITPIVPIGMGNPPLNFVRLKDGMLNIAMPTLKMLKDAEDAIKIHTGRYQFPDEYDDAYTCGPKSKLDPDDREMIQKARLADYCISICM